MPNDATIHIYGNLTKAAERKESNTTGDPYLLLTVAVNTTIKKKDADPNDRNSYESNYYYASLYGKQIDRLEPLLTKGTPVEVFGEFQMQKYQSQKTGQMETSGKITAWKVSIRPRWPKKEKDDDSPF
jgi:single-stranded DNA-binding protein